MKLHKKIKNEKIFSIFICLILAYTAKGQKFANTEVWSSTPFLGYWISGAYTMTRTRVADVDGDGKNDIIAIKPNGIFVRRSNGCTFTNDELWLSGSFGGANDYDEYSFALELTAPISYLPDYFPYVTSQGSYVKSYLFNSQTDQVYYDSYDNKGNILQFHKKNDLNVSYIWGYNNTYPVLKGENIDQNTLQTAVNNSLPYGFLSLVELLTAENGIKDMTSTIQKNLWDTFCESLTGQSSLSKAMVTFYTYPP